MTLVCFAPLAFTSTITPAINSVPSTLFHQHHPICAITAQTTVKPVMTPTTVHSADLGLFCTITLALLSVLNTHL